MAPLFLPFFKSFFCLFYQKIFYTTSTMFSMNDRITKEKLERYLSLTQKGLEIIEILPPEKSHLFGAANDFFLMAKSYYSDALFYFGKEDYVTSFASVNYAHGYLDAGIRLGIFRGRGEALFAFEDVQKGMKE